MASNPGEEITASHHERSFPKAIPQRAPSERGADQTVGELKAENRRLLQRLGAEFRGYPQVELCVESASGLVEGVKVAMPVQTEKIRQTDPERKYRKVLAASTLAGDAVKNSAGEDLGKIDEIMIDIPTGRVAYAVLSFGGFLRMGNRLFAVPWDVLTVDEDRKHFILDVDKGHLENAPGFDKDNWPDMADRSFGTKIYGYYGRTPYWERTEYDEPIGRRSRSTTTNF
jgi:sporulation protein YlmC with PRC-barrel domain